MRRDVLFSVVCLVAATLLNLFKGDNEVISDKAFHSISARDRFGDSSSYYRVREHPPVLQNHLKLKPHGHTYIIIKDVDHH